MLEIHQKQKSPLAKFHLELIRQLLDKFHVELEKKKRVDEEQEKRSLHFDWNTKMVITQRFFQEQKKKKYPKDGVVCASHSRCV